MRVLIVHNRYLLPGGEDHSTDAELRMLRNAGVDADLFEMDNGRVAELSGLRTAAKSVWSTKIYNQVRRLVRDKGYDVVHVQNFFPLISPSVYYAARAEGAAVVQSLRNYRLFCVNGLFFRDNRPCTDCLRRSVPWPGVVHACYRDSRAASAAVAAMLTAHRAARTWQRAVDLYVTATEFTRGKAVEGGLPAKRMFVKPNFVDPDPGPGRGDGDYAVFVGRLSAEKGLDTLLSAWRQSRSAWPLKVVGDGPLRSLVTEASERREPIKWLGRRALEETYDIIGAASVLIFPSRAYETFGRTIVEAFAKGTPVVCSDIGTAAELVEDGRTGWHVRAGDAEDIAAKVAWLADHPKALARMRRAARLEYEAKYTARRNLDLLLQAYVLARRACSAQGRRAGLASASHT